MTVTVEPPPADGLEADVIEQARARQRRHRRVGATVVLAGAVAAAAIFAIGGGGNAHGSGPAATLARGPRAAARSAQTGSPCVWRPMINGKPDGAMLTTLGVLRRPATPAGRAPRAPFFASFTWLGAEIYSHDTRLARVLDGVRYYLIPVHYDGCAPANQHGPGPSGDGIFMQALGGIGGGFGGDAAQIASGLAWETGPGYIAGVPGGVAATVVGLVPDDVREVTVRYPSHFAVGDRKVRLPAVTVTTRPVGNVVVYEVPRNSGTARFPQMMIWHGVDGRVIKTLSGPL